MKKRAAHSVLIVAVNVLLIAAAILFLIKFSDDYNERLRQENLRNIENLNQSAANIADSYFNTRREKIADIVRYVLEKDLTLEETLEYVNDSSSALSMNSIQLIGEDYCGTSALKNADGSYTPVNYNVGDYGQLQRIFRAAHEMDETLTTPEFTDNYSGTKSFALYTYLPLRDGQGGRAAYTLMLLAKSRDVVNLINPDGGYADMSTALINSRGEYIMSNIDFKAGNFFDYLYNYNDLSLDERNTAANAVSSSEAGELYYMDSHGRDCVFRYTRIAESDWYCVTGVPLSSFHMTNYWSAVLLMAAIMSALLAIDVVWLTALNKRLKISMETEQQANSAKSDFLSRMSHDIRTPLNGIIGSTILALDEKNPKATNGYLHAIETSGRFLLGLVNDVLDMSKVESGKMTLQPEPYRLGDLAEYLNAVILPLARDKGINLNVSVDGAEGGALMLDRLRIHQICFNLLSNAVKFSNAGSEVRLAAVQRPEKDGGALLEITVSDQGIGMSSEFQHRMFDPFSQEHRVSNAQSGTGLGLAIVKNLVGLMNGEMTCKSSENVGTTFTLRIPASVCPNTPQEPVRPVLKTDALLQGKRVLLVEDNDTNRIIAVQLLKKRGVIAETAENGRVGVDRFLASGQGYFDAVLMDIMMPVMDGLAASRAIRESTHPDAKRIPIIAMTANAYTSDVQKCFAAGMNGHVPKPIEPLLMFDTLAHAIHNAAAPDDLQ